MGDWTGFDYLSHIDDGWGGSVRTLYPVPSGDFESIMTDGDSGVLFTWSLTNEASCSYQALINRESVQTGCSDPTWDVKVFSSATGATTSVGHLLPAPVLQAQDGMFVGNAINTDGWTTVNLAGFNADGSVKWLGPPNYQSLFTTSDGGGVAETDSGQFVTFDQSGSITGQLPSMPILSWKGAYRVRSSSLDSVVPSDFILATSLASARGPITSIDPNFLENGLDSSPSGNLTGNGSSAAHHTLGLFFCRVTLNGSCQSMGDTDLGFTYAPAPISETRGRKPGDRRDVF